MGTTLSTQSALQIPVEESLFPPGQTQYSLRDTVDNDPVLRGRFGYRIDATLYQGTSGRIMKTFPLRTQRSNSNNATTSSTADRALVGTECTAVAKATWILEQTMENNESGFRTTTWLEEQVRELQRIRKAVQQLPHVAPFSAWFISPEPLKSTAPRNTVQSVLMAPQRKYYLPQPFAPSPVTIRAVCLVRAAVYTTLADRLASRPWLTMAEKLWITQQLCEAVQQLHDVNVVHGFLTTENIGLTSTGYVILLDLSSYKARTMLPDDDPSEFLYYFQPQSSSGTAIPNTAATSNTRRIHHPSSNHSEKRCYLAPERFYTPSSSTKSAESSSLPSEPPLAPAMDIFSLGCVITELFLNGERCLDLGDLMEYRRLNSAPDTSTTNTLPSSLQQKLNKIESSAVRAACKHMLAVDPTKRLTARAYQERLQAADRFPVSFSRLTRIAEQMVTGYSWTSRKNIEAVRSDGSKDDVPAMSTGFCTLSPDARMALLAMEYSNVVWETMGVRDAVGAAYFQKVLGAALRQAAMPPVTNSAEAEGEETRTMDKYSLGSTEHTQELLANVGALLQELDSAVFPSSEPGTSGASTKPSAESGMADGSEREERSDLTKSTLLIFLQMVLSTVHHAQRPTTKLIALQLVQRLSVFSLDETRLQRIVPMSISLLNDQDPLVRASSVQVLASTLMTIHTFPPSDSKVFPQYIFKRILHLISDPAFVVRLAFAGCIADLAETARRFLDISHAVRLYEAVGNGASGSVSRDEMILKTGGDEKDTSAVFGDEVVKLLDKSSRVSSGISLESEPPGATVDPSSANSDNASVFSGTTLISSTYNAELASLYETVSRWVAHIATDQSEHCSLPKRAILNDLNRFCSFFGLEGSMSFILPQVLTFLNERKDWELRALLLEHLPSVCRCIGRAATEEFVLPCIEIGLVDSEERVICSGLSCLSRIAMLGLLSRNAIIDNSIQQNMVPSSPSLLKKYGPLLLFPSESVRDSAICAVVSICTMIGLPDCNVYIFPLLCPYFRGRPDFSVLFSESSLKDSLKCAWTRYKVATTLDEIKSSEKSMLWTPGAWTSIGVTVSDDTEQGVKAVSDNTLESSSYTDPEERGMREYLKILAKHQSQTSSQDRSLSDRASTSLIAGFEASGKLAQSIMFPKQNFRIKSDHLPEWYASLRDAVENSKGKVSESVSIRSVSSLGRIYGLSIMGIEGVTKNEFVISDDGMNAEVDAHNLLRSAESVNIEGAFKGEWGSESVLDPEIVDTTYLITKMKALNVPPLSVNLGNPYVTETVGNLPLMKDFTFTTEWKPRMKSLLATSTTCSGHTAPVVRLAASVDQNFFVSASHDGTCRVWDTAQVDDTDGLLDSSILYTEHSNNGPCRVNDVAMLEGTYSVVSGASDGSVHIWRADVVEPSGQTPHSRRPQAIGSTNIRKVDAQEGEILAVSHFNSSFGSIVTYGTQFGVVHSWDLRCALEPFKIRHSPELGFLTSMALGSDRNWIVSGTSRGYIALWDIRFQQCLKLWRHSRDAPIARLATSTVPPPDHWGLPTSSGSARPFIFASAGVNECSMFDVFSGRCTECFRTVTGDKRSLNSYVQDPPDLLDIPFTRNRSSGTLKPAAAHDCTSYATPLSSINCMVGSVGDGNHSYLITGGSDGRIRFWDFSSPSKCFVISGISSINSRPAYERIDYEGQRRLMLCRQVQNRGLREFNVQPRKLLQGLKKVERYHTDSVLDIKLLDQNRIVSCSRDCTVKVWS
jgi:phosphoinositide-3-kinase, regulatory subunit 4